MTINELTQSGGIGPLRGLSPKSTPTIEPKSEPTAQPADRADLGSGVQNDARLLDAAHMVFNALPDIRAVKVALAKQRLADGYYDLPDIQDQIASKLAGDPEASPDKPLDSTRQAQIQNRLSDGYYDKPKVLDQTAQALANDAEQ